MIRSFIRALSAESKETFLAALNTWLARALAFGLFLGLLAFAILGNVHL